MLFIYAFPEVIDCDRVHVELSVVRKNALRVVLVLNFHSCELTDVYIVSEVFPGSHPLVDLHVHVEGFVGFLLAVSDAMDLVLANWLGKLLVHAVAVALGEELARKRIVPQGVSHVQRVLSPVRHIA